MIAKLAPDLSDDALIETVSALSELDVDGFIFSNTTNTRPDSLVEKEIASEQGGLSGAPLFELSTGKLEIVTSHTDKPVIAVGGIQTKEHAKEKLNKGAKLVQLYTGLIFKGPELVKECLSTTA